MKWNNLGKRKMRKENGREGGRRGPGIKCEKWKRKEKFSEKKEKKWKKNEKFFLNFFFFFQLRIFCDGRRRFWFNFQYFFGKFAQLFDCFALSEFFKVIFWKIIWVKKLKKSQMRKKITQRIWTSLIAFGLLSMESFPYCKLQKKHEFI